MTVAGPMNTNHVEEYLGAIYRLRASAEQPVPLPQVRAYLNYTLISIHEMVRKLADQDFINYKPYRGVILTPKGEKVAAALVRRHRIWERFLTDMLSIPWDETHLIAGQLEHAAPELVTERLAWLMGDPEFCPHGSSIPQINQPASPGSSTRQPGGAETGSLLNLLPGTKSQVVSITPELPEYLSKLNRWGIGPGVMIDVCGYRGQMIEIQANGQKLEIPEDLARVIRVNLVTPGEKMQRMGA